MRLLTLSLEQFRNYGALRLEFPSADLQFLIGPNGSGKTNVLESLSLLSLTRSFLGLEEQDLIQWGKEFYRLKATMRSDAGEEKELEIVSQIAPRRQKGCFVNGVRVPLTRIIGELPTVTFLPQDLALFTGPPAERRRFLDQLLCQVFPEYFQMLLEYQKILKQRNALLKSIATKRAYAAEMDPWNAELAARGSYVTLMRLELMETFNLTIRDDLRALGETWADVKMTYVRGGQARTREEIRLEMIEALGRNLERDVILQSTTVGPHRDDWRLEADGHPLQSFASRGQQRVAILALLFLEASYLELRRGERPVILLDDIFSELDDAHRESVVRAFGGHQVFLTGTHLPGETQGGSIWGVEEGRVTEPAAVA